MKQTYINKIKTNLSIFSNKKTNNVLEGSYKSIYKGKSENFENLREYTINDDIKDIAWKSGAKTASLLVKEFVAQKKQNILLLMDTGLKMEADTKKNEKKKDLSLLIAGTIGYLAIKNNDLVGMLYSQNENIIYHPFKGKLENLDKYLQEYDKNSIMGKVSMNELLNDLYKNIHKKMILFIITDKSGIDSLEEKKIRELNKIHDILLINIKDHNHSGTNLFDIEQNRYLPDIFLNDKKLMNLEEEIEEEKIKKIKKLKISITSISEKKEINKKIIELLKEHKHGN